MNSIRSWQAKAILLSVVLSALFFARALQAQVWIEPDQSAQAFRVVDLRFYEGGFDSPPLEQRVYSTSFPLSSSRYIHAEVYLENKLWSREDVRVNLDFKFYYPDGTLFGEVPFEHTIPMAEQWYYFWQGYGYDTPGEWITGQYRAEVWFAGRKLAEGHFNITGDAAVTSTTPSSSSVSADSVTLTEIRFFEAGTDTDSSRIYKTTFPVASRYIYTEVTLENHRYNVSENPIDLDYRYYKQDRSLFGQTGDPFTIPIDWDFAELWEGWGWADPGYWEPGRYTVEVWNAGKKLGEGGFTIQ